MKPAAHVRQTRTTFTAIVAGLTLLATANCAEDLDDVETTQGAITGGWTNLQLISPWANYHPSTYPPAIGIVNGVVTFRGAIKNTSSNPTSDIAFRLDPAAFANLKPQPLNRLFMRALMRTSGGTDVGGTVEFNPLEDPINGTQPVHIHQDGVNQGVVGSAAKNYTSLEGLAFDRVSGTPLDQDDTVWQSVYGLRQSEGGCSGCGAYVKMVDGFVRMQGFLQKSTEQQNNFDGYLFTLPSTPTNFRPGQNVTVPCNLGDPQSAVGSTSWGALTIYPSGDVFVNGNPPAANKGTSFEGVFFSKTNSGNVNLPLSNGWHAHSARTVKVGKYGDVVRFQGAISGGTSGTIGTLPAGYAPARTVRLVAAANGPVPATIVVNTSGVMTVEGPPLNVSALFLSLDGVSYGR